MRKSHAWLAHPKTGEDETLGQKEEYSWDLLLGIFFKIPPIFFVTWSRPRIRKKEMCFLGVFQ